MKSLHYFSFIHSKLLRYLPLSSRKALSCLLCATMALSIGVGIPAQAKADLKDDARLVAESFAIAEIVPNALGSWSSSRGLKQAEVGDVEQLTLSLHAGENMVEGESVDVEISSSVLDFRNTTPMLAIDIDGNIFSREIDTKVYKNSVELTLNMTGLLMNEKAKIFIYVEGMRTEGGGHAKATLSRNIPKSFLPASSVSVGEYSVRKQGKGLNSVEKPVGISGMGSVDSAYIVSKNNKELIRFYFSGGSLVGLGIRFVQGVAGVEYDISNKIYINALTKKNVLSKAEMINILSTLDFSYMRSPNESKWFSSQPGYSQQLTLNFQ